MRLKDCLIGLGLAVATWTAAFDAAAGVEPQGIAHAGRLFDSQGKPVVGSLKMTFTLYDTKVEGVARWTETVDVEFDDGNYEVELGTVRPIDGALLDGSLRWLGLAMGDGPQIPGRLAIACDPVVAVKDESGAPEPPRASEADGDVKRPSGVVLAAEFAQAVLGPLAAAGDQAFLGATVRMTVAPAQAVLVSGRAVVGSTARTGAENLHMSVCARRISETRLVDIPGDRLAGLRVAAASRQSFAVRSRFADLAPGEYEFGLCGRVAAATSQWNDNDEAVVSVLLTSR